MSRQGWLQWVEPIATISIVVTLVVLIMEVRGNTLAIERQIRLDFSSSLTQPFVDDSDMAQILSKIKAVDGREPSVSAFMKRYGLTETESASWTRYQIQLWGGLEADFLHSGPAAVEPRTRLMLAFPDVALFWEVDRTTYSPEFREFVEAIRTETAGER